MPRLSPLVYALLIPALAAACQTTVNLTEGSATNTEGGADETTTNNSSGTNNGTTDPQTTDDCVNGTEGCPCYGNGTCNDKLVCNGKNVCEQPPGETTGETTGGTTTDTTGAPSTDSTTSSGTTSTTTDSSDTTTGGDASLDGWTKYREVLIDQGEPVDLADFQVFIDVAYDSDMAPDYSDLRFTDATGTKLLPYWIEYDTGPVNAYVWVRVPAIAGDDITTIRMYYGNPDAAPASDGSSTFLFFDDFTAAELDAMKWKSTAPVTVDFGRLQLTKGAVYGVKPVADFPGTTLEARMEWYQEGGNAYPSGLTASTGQAPGPGITYLRRDPGAWIVFDGDQFLLEQNTGSSLVGQPKIIGISVGEKNSWFSLNRYDDKLVSHTFNFQYYPIFGHPWGKNVGLDEVGNVDIDWVLVRRHTRPEPATLVGGEKTL